MSQELAEGIADGLMTFYRSNLPAKLEALNALYQPTTEVLTLVPPSDGAFHDGEKALTDAADYPKLFVFVEAMEINAYNRNYTDANYPCIVTAALKGAETDILQRLMYRWGKALWELTVERYFQTTPDNYFMLHGQGDIKIEYQRPAAFDVPPPYYARIVLTFKATRQENVV